MGGRLLGVLALLLGGCLPAGGGGGGSSCSQGEVRRCSCAGGPMGLQSCGDDSRYGECVCGAAGAGGASGAGGAGGDAGGRLPSVSFDLSSPPALRDGGAVQRDGFRPLRDARPPMDFGRPSPEADFGRPPRDFGPPPRDFGGGPPDGERPRRWDAEVIRDAEPSEVIPDAQPDRSVAQPDAGGQGPECRGEDDCRSACDWLRWCFESPSVCATPNPRYAGDVEDTCREHCVLLTARVCRLRNCTELNRAAPGLGDDWREVCSN